MDEREFQRRMVEAAEAEGGYSFKMSNRFLVGVPDLFIKLPDLPVVLLECKMERRPSSHRAPGHFTSATRITPQQGRHLRRAQQAGVAAGWAVCAPGANGNHRIYVSVDVSGALGSTDKRGPGEFERVRGRPWPVRDVVSYIALCSPHE